MSLAGTNQNNWIDVAEVEELSARIQELIDSAEILKFLPSVFRFSIFHGKSSVLATPTSG